MYTVIILNKQSSELIKDYRFMFKPFVDKGMIGFCDWNEAGTDVKTSVPDLCDLIKGKKDWRAVIVNTDSIYGYKDCPVPKKNNPFDYAEFENNSLPHESSVPIIKLAHIIGGYTSFIAKEFEKGFEYFDPELGKKIRVKESELTTEELNSLNETYDEVFPVYIEKKLPEEVKSLQQKLVDKYAFSEIRPVEIDLVATRSKSAINERVLVEESWKNHLESKSSNFWEENKYPNNCRFLVYDITNQENSFYKKELMEFWMSVLTLAINRVAASTLQAYRLYKIGVDVSKENLKKILDTHLNKLNSAYMFVKEQINLKPEYTFEEDEEVLKRQIVPVVIGKDETKDLFITFESIGLARDYPEDEGSFWRSQVKKKKLNLEKYFKTPRRSIDKSANALKKKATGFKEEMFVLDQFQKDDLKESLYNLENEIVSSEVKCAIDKKSVNQRLDEVDAEVKKEIGYRLSRKTILVCSCVFLLICFGGYLPYLFSAVDVGWNCLFAAFFVIMAVLAVSAFGGLVALFIQRRRLIKKMDRFNHVMRKVTNDMRSYSNRFEDYFSNICTYMKGVSILEGAKKHKTGPDVVNDVLMMHKKAILTSVGKAREWIVSYDIVHTDEVIANVTTFFDVNRPPRENSLYFFEANTDENDIPINSTGDMVSAPYKFIEKFWVQREDVYDEEEE